MDSSRELAYKLSETICTCTSYSVEAIQALKQKVWIFINSCVETYVKAVQKSIDCIFSRLKAFYDNLTETLKDSMVQTKKNIDEICSAIHQIVSKGENFSAARAAKLVQYLVKFSEYVKSFYDVIGVISKEKIIKKRLMDFGHVLRKTFNFNSIMKLLRIMVEDPTIQSLIINVTIVVLYLVLKNE